MRIKRRRFTFQILPFIIALVIAISLPAMAWANNFVGGSQTGLSNIQGVESNIYTATYTFQGSPHTASIWPMFEQDMNNYAQSGYLYEVTGSYPEPHYFYGWGIGGVYHETDAMTGPAYNTWHTYYVGKGASTMYGEVDGSTIGSSALLNGNIADYDSETYPNSTSTDYIGTSSSQSEFSQVNYMNSNYIWVKPSLSWESDSYSSINKSYWSSGGYWYSHDSRF